MTPDTSPVTGAPTPDDRPAGTKRVQVQWAESALHEAHDRVTSWLAMYFAMEATGEVVYSTNGVPLLSSDITALRDATRTLLAHDCPEPAVSVSPVDTDGLRQRIAQRFSDVDARDWGGDHGFVPSYGSDTESDAFVDAAVEVFEQAHGDLVVRAANLRSERDAARAAIADIDAHATPIGLLNPDDPDGSPLHYAVTTGSLHRALGKAYTAEKCDAERERLRSEVERLRAEVASRSTPALPDGAVDVAARWLLRAGLHVDAVDTKVRADRMWQRDLDEEDRDAWRVLARDLLADLGLSSPATDPADEVEHRHDPAEDVGCTNPPAVSCSDPGCPRHGWDTEEGDDDE
jgi:hypothetical protein